MAGKSRRVGCGGSGLNAVVGDEVGGVAVGGGDAWGGNLLAGVDRPSDGEVEVEELLEEVFLRAEATGIEDGGVERGVGVLEGVCAVEFEYAVEDAKAPLDGRK